MYILYILTILGNQTDATVDTNALTTSQLVGVILRRTAVIAIDYVLATIILPWPFSFFLDFPGNPVTWRWRVGVKDAEIIIRESRNWGADDLVKGSKKGADSPFWANRIAPAVEMHYIKGKTGYVMMGKDWDLDFERMIWAEEFVKEKGLSIREFRTKVLVHMDGLGWLSWTADWEDDDNVGEEEARKNIQAFHEKLTLLGKESLFFRWIELIQYETNSKAGMSKESMLKQAKDMFGEQGIDFEGFVESLGGIDTLPGMAEAKAKQQSAVGQRGLQLPCRTAHRGNTDLMILDCIHITSKMEAPCVDHDYLKIVWRRSRNFSKAAIWCWGELCADAAQRVKYLGAAADWAASL
ncbi:hypothetical protein FH972_022017 [Carpinus fangiana]|uniref:Uncharacterized protein n=1 Tax=Carpinus fangiana TaxID=176857 RepID=A0A5N6KT75_9ROSI|nr:hypothetical protein FH972_022017 [Carpinus fangiana]